MLLLDQNKNCVYCKNINLEVGYFIYCGDIYWKKISHIKQLFRYCISWIFDQLFYCINIIMSDFMKMIRKCQRKYTLINTRWRGIWTSIFSVLPSQWENTATRLYFIACIIHAPFLTSTRLYYPHQYWNMQWEEVISSAVYVCHKWTKTNKDSRIWYQSNKTCMLIAIQYFNPSHLVWGCN